jgi:hypothetical protein
MLLAGAGAGVVGALAMTAWPRWIQQAFSRGVATEGEINPEPEATPCPGARKKPSTPEEPTTPTGRVRNDPGKMLQEAARRARSEGKKLLVLVIPEDTGLRHDRGTIFGEFLNHGSSADLAPLASAVVVCARTAALTATFGVTIEGEPLMLVLDPGVSPASVLALDARILPLTDTAEQFPRRDSPRVEERISRRIQQVAALVRQGLGAAPADELEARARTVQASVVKRPPPGGRWGHASGCGVDYEAHDEGEKEDSGVACGMGFVPARSSRFLDFLVARAR